jgi:tetratricopeptide (TPR) repeat protein
MALLATLIVSAVLGFWRSHPEPLPPTYFEDGYVALQHKDYDQAIGLFTQALDRNPTDAQALVERGQAYMSKKSYALALADFNQAIKLDDKEPDYYLNRIDIYLFHQRNDDLALKDAQAFTICSPKNPWARYLLALVHLQRRELAEALQASKEAVELDPGKAEFFIMRADVHRALYQFEEGIKDCNVALKLDPSQANAYRLRGILRFAIKRTEQGLQDLSRAIEMVPLNARVYATRAGVWFALEKRDESLADWTQAIQVAPENPSYLAGRAKVYLRQRNYPCALADLDDALRIGPESPSGYEVFAYLRATAPDPAQRDGQQALRLVRKAMECIPKPNASILTTLAAAHAEVGDFEKAQIAQTQALALVSDFLPDDLEEAKAQLELYKAKKPYRDAAPLPSH